MDNILKEREDFNAMLGAAMNTTGSVHIGKEGWDDDLLELFEAYASNPIAQLVFCQVQTNRSLQRMQVMLQAIGAYLAKVDAPETEKAATST